MKNTIGNEITITLFGESHGEAIGCVLDGLPSGIEINEAYINEKMNQRKAVGKISTGRHEADEVHYLSGVKDAKTEGTPIAIMIQNTNMHSKDYASLSHIARPSHADYAAHLRYSGYEDARGGGHFSGRLTAPIVAAGSILRYALEQKGIVIASHIQNLHGIEDKSFTVLEKEMNDVNHKAFPVLDDEIGLLMQKEIENARDKQDSVGGILETVITGIDGGIGEPTFSSVESRLSEAIFSIPAVKGLEFGSGFELANMYGSEANDAWMIQDGKAVTKTNHNGGINGGITNGMPIVFKTVIKPTPSISLTQDTIDYEKMENVQLNITGRHDPAIIHRARAVVDALTAFVIADMYYSTYGRKWFEE